MRGEMERINLRINGMSCGHCVASVSGALQQVSGARVERVEIGLADVSYDPTSTSRADVVDAVRNAGYEVESVAQPS